MFCFTKTNIFFIFLLTICSSTLYSQQISELSENSELKHIKQPAGFHRVKIIENSFAEWLQNLPLKTSESPVVDFRGKIFKSKDDSTVAAVIDYNIKGKRLEQCMDILVRFYAEYLWQQNRTDELNLPLPGGYQIDWKSWKQGFRPFFSGIDVTIKRSKNPDSSKQNYDKYLRTVFSESHTQQFYYAYKTIDRRKVRIGDFIVKKGVEGHAVMIVDLAQNDKDELIALIGQGDTPACEFYLLNYRKNNPCFPLVFSIKELPLPIRKKITWDGLRRFDKKMNP